MLAGIKKRPQSRYLVECFGLLQHSVLTVAGACSFHIDVGSATISADGVNLRTSCTGGVNRSLSAVGCRLSDCREHTAMCIKMVSPVGDKYCSSVDLLQKPKEVARFSLHWVVTTGL
jgi:hypothetical protein